MHIVMNGKNWLSILATALAGVLLIIFYKRGDVLVWIVMLLGAGLVVPGLYNLYVSARMRKKLEFADAATRTRSVPAGSAAASIVASVAGIALGIWLLSDPAFFVKFSVYLFSGLLVVYGIYELVYVIWLSRPFRLPFYFCFVPVLMIVGGIAVLCTSICIMNHNMILLTGILLLASAVNSALEYMAMSPVRHRGQTGV